jgi:hypothetical protein
MTRFDGRTLNPFEMRGTSVTGYWVEAYCRRPTWKRATPTWSEATSMAAQPHSGARPYAGTSGLAEFEAVAEGVGGVEALRVRDRLVVDDFDVVSP